MTITITGRTSTHLGIKHRMNLGNLSTTHQLTVNEQSDWSTGQLNQHQHQHQQSRLIDLIGSIDHKSTNRSTTNHRWMIDRDRSNDQQPNNNNQPINWSTNVNLGTPNRSINQQSCERSNVNDRGMRELGRNQRTGSNWSGHVWVRQLGQPTWSGQSNPINQSIIQSTIRTNWAGQR